MAKQPFGEHDCESEIQKLGERYSELFFDQTPFNQAALDPDTYLIVGRRGAGKTALCHYFSFQRDVRNAIYIDVDEPSVYERVLAKVASHSNGSSNSYAAAKASDIWEYLLWKLIMAECDSWQSNDAGGSDALQPEQSPAGVLDRVIDWMKERIGIGRSEDKSNEGLSDQGLNLLMREVAFSEGREQVLRLAAKTPIFLAIDTLEKYNINDAGLMKAMAGLVEAAARMNLSYAARGVHIKVFMSGEVFPHLVEVELANPLKSVKQEVYMLWRYRDLLRLIAWRFHHFLKSEGLLPRTAIDIVWNDPKDVLERAWTPFFGKEVKNRHGIPESTFPYVLRHTQMRPRQLIVLCNSIATRCISNGKFPQFSRSDIIEGIEVGERILAGEILNSYSQIYPGANEIVRVLSQITTTFQGNQLDKRAPESKRHWKAGDYSPAAFSRLVTELGIVGRITREAPGYVDAEFSYAQSHRVEILHRDSCAIHPMFFRFLNVVQPEKPVIVFPFSVSNEDQRLLGRWDSN